MPSIRPFGSVRQRGNFFEASYWHNGRRHVAPAGFATKGDARSFLASVENGHPSRIVDRSPGRTHASP